MLEDKRSSPTTLPKPLTTLNGVLFYSGLTAAVWAGLLSSPFELHRGTWQGCLLSPLLFALAVELLACLVRQSSDVVGFRVGALEDADDMLLYLGDVASSITPVMTIMQGFGRWSGLLINWVSRFLCPLTRCHLLSLSRVRSRWSQN